MQFLNACLLVLLSIAVVAAMPLINAAVALTQVIFKVAELSPAQPDDCPKHWQETIQTALKLAHSLGFEVVSYDWRSSSLAEDRPLWGVTLQTSAGDIHLSLEANPASTDSTTLVLNCHTYFTDGTCLTTTNQKQVQVFQPNPKHVLCYLGGDKLEALYATHCKLLVPLKAKKTIHCLTAEKLAQTRKRQYLDDLAYLAQIKAIDWVQPRKTYRLSLLTAAQIALARWQTRPKQPAQTKSQPDSNPQPNSTQEGLLKQQVADFFAAKQLKEQGVFKSRLRRWSGLCLSLGAFIVVYALKFPPQTLVIFVGALLLHEAGHVAAMWLFGYKEVSMVFIPFLGALATARKDNATLTERFWISLAGPLPGLLLGLYLGYQGMQENQDLFQWLRQGGWQQEACMILIALNLFNLIPIYPLDGGQIVNLLLFSKNAFLGFCFQGLGVLCFVLIGLTQPLFLVFALLVGLTLPRTWQIARTRSKLHQQLRHLDASNQEHFIRTVFQQFQQPPYQHWPLHKQQMIATGLLESHREHKAPWSARIGLAGIYLLTLVFSMSNIITGLMPAIQQAAGEGFVSYLSELREKEQKRLIRSYQDQREQAWQNLNQEIARNPQNPDVYLQRAKIYCENENYRAALVDVNYVIYLDSQNFEGYRLRSWIHTKLGDLESARADDRKAAELFWPRRR
jgi:Zn-dependent protease